MAYTQSTRDSVPVTIRLPLALEEHLRVYALARQLTVADVITSVLERWRFDGIPRPATPAYCPDLIDLALWCRQRYPRLPATTRCLYVYFFSAGDTGYVKVGFSASPEERLIDVQTNCMFRIELAAKMCVANARGCEKFLHERLQALHLWGEWFYIPKPIFTVFLDTLLA